MQRCAEEAREDRGRDGRDAASSPGTPGVPALGRGRKDPSLVLARAEVGAFLSESYRRLQASPWWASQCRGLHLCHRVTRVSGEEWSGVFLVVEGKGPQGADVPFIPSGLCTLQETSYLPYEASMVWRLNRILCSAGEGEGGIWDPENRAEDPRAQLPGIQDFYLPYRVTCPVSSCLLGNTHPAYHLFLNGKSQRRVYCDP